MNNAITVVGYPDDYKTSSTKSGILVCNVWLLVKQGFKDRYTTGRIECVAWSDLAQQLADVCQSMRDRQMKEGLLISLRGRAAELALNLAQASRLLRIALRGRAAGLALNLATCAQAGAVSLRGRAAGLALNLR